METIQGEEPIALQSLHISSAISGGMAQTTVRMVFFNPNARPLEGNLQFPLLAGQQVTAFALDIEGKLRPAVPVEKAKGRKIFEEVERRNVDPALLETTQGNNFKLRVYPVPARGTRTVELKYAETLARDGAHWNFRLPLAYGERVKDFDLKVKIDGSKVAPKVRGALGALEFTRTGDAFVAHVAKSRYAPSGTLMLSVQGNTQPHTYVQEREGSTYFVTEIPVSKQRTQRTLPNVVGLLWDSSGSGATRAHDAELRELEVYFKAVTNAEVRLTRLRDRAEKAEVFKITNGNWDALRSALKATIYDGASNLSDWQPQADVGEYVLVSDGLANYGSGELPALAAAQRLYALSSSMAADAVRLASWAERSGGQMVQIDPQQKPGSAAQALLTDGPRISQIKATGASDVLVDSSAVQQGLLRVAGKLTSSSAQLEMGVVQQGNSKQLNVAVSAKAPAHPLAAYVWANLRLRELEANFEAHRAEIRRLGTLFDMPTRETSLIVLDRVEDYVRYDVLPPAELVVAFNEVKRLVGSRLQDRRQKQLERLVTEFNEKITWWEKTYPKGELPKPPEPKPSALVGSVAPSAARPTMAAPPPSPAPAAMAARASDAQRDVARKSTGSEAGQPDIGIAIKKWRADAPYMTRFAAAAGADQLYAAYLDEKPDYAKSSGFFLDAADLLLEKGQRELGLRVLSNLAEMDLEDRHLLRILGHRLMQAGAPELAIPVFKKVLHLAQEEPQSYRDLGLAHAAAGHYQQAVDQLTEVIVRPWDNRFAEIELIALAELNALIANVPAAAAPLDTCRIDPRLLKNMPLDLRAVLTWDADNSDMDLWVTDPNGEKCFYGKRFSYQGGRMSRDFTGGYGPEEFSLRDAKPGKYKIEANFFASRQQTVAGQPTLTVRLITGFATANEKAQTITLRLKSAKDTVMVGEFEVKPK